MSSLSLIIRLALRDLTEKTEQRAWERFMTCDIAGVKRRRGPVALNCNLEISKYIRCFQMAKKMGKVVFAFLPWITKLPLWCWTKGNKSTSSVWRIKSTLFLRKGKENRCDCQFQISFEKLSEVLVSRYTQIFSGGFLFSFLLLFRSSCQAKAGRRRRRRGPEYSKWRSGESRFLL